MNTENHTDQEKKVLVFGWFALEITDFVWSRVASLSISMKINRVKFGNPIIIGKWTIETQS